MKGYVQVYTGNGKGKTTAGLGLALRGSGAGLQVFVGQFLKQGNYSEIKALSRFKNVTVEQFGMGRFVTTAPSEQEKAAARAGYARLCQILKANAHDLVIVDEGNVAVTYRLISEEELLALIDMKPENVELVITGRGASSALKDRADLVTEMKNIKHYFQQGVRARIGIEK
ncbi:MAG: cob(I)yrinic acid a,c-diamide adenosyltransferase [Desulfotignum sp.]|nr:cob(I)yrinic acid a,c-diamide adenosyltransferase [Desulfotignum sp.]MCF8112877.1 cob(I)yrinic acid a,c-diamide adenosyltransferase [Desulfotignum sp.]MCF8125985.1 cob(I)yrinic acid a,c-diamide adenosyltransferase [Desulfotignum sp.]